MISKFTGSAVAENAEADDVESEMVSEKTVLPAARAMRLYAAALTKETVGKEVKAEVFEAEAEAEADGAIKAACTENGALAEGMHSTGGSSEPMYPVGAELETEGGSRRKESNRFANQSIDGL